MSRMDSMVFTILWIVSSFHHRSTYSLEIREDNGAACDLSFVKPSSCDLDLLDQDDDFYKEAVKTVQCFSNRTLEVGDNATQVVGSAVNSFSNFKCLVTEIRRLLNCSESISVPDEKMMQLFFDGTLDYELNSYSEHQYNCVLCILVQFIKLLHKEFLAINYDEQTCDFYSGGIIRNISLWFELSLKVQHFIFELENVKYVRSYVNDSEFLGNPWIERFLDSKTWETYEFNVRTYMMVLSTDSELGSGMQTFLLVLHGILFCLGFLGNITLLLIFARNREMLSSHNMLILNLAIGDVFSLIFNIIVSYTFNLADSMAVGFLVCLSITLFIPLSSGVCVYSVTMLSVQRFLAVHATGKRHGCFKYLNSVSFMIFVWVLAIIAAVPQFIKTEFHEDYCSVELSTFRTLFNLIVYCVIPIIAVAAFSIATSQTMRRSVRKMPGEVMGQQSVRNARTRSANILIGLIVVFAISYFPYYLFLFVYNYLDIEKFAFDNIFIISYTLIFVNSCSNPIALYAASGVFRNYFNKYLFNGCKTKFELWRQKSDTSSRTTQKSTVSE